MELSDIPTPMFPRYPQLGVILFRVGAAILLRKTRSLRRDAEALIAKLDPPLQVVGHERIPRSGPCVITANHYARPGFGAWWLALVISAVIPGHIHWIMTGAWTFPGRWYRRLLRPISECVLAHIAQVYGFTPMPPMPPDPAEAEARATAVRRVLAYVRQTPQPIVGLVPEGRDFPGGVLGWPPPGVGRFILHLAGLGLDIAPIGVYEEDGALCLSFGPHYRPEVPIRLPPDERDRAVGRIVMDHIANQLPLRLRGEFGNSF